MSLRQLEEFLNNPGLKNSDGNPKREVFLQGLRAAIRSLGRIHGKEFTPEAMAIEAVHETKDHLGLYAKYFPDDDAGRISKIYETILGTLRFSLGSYKSEQHKVLVRNFCGLVLEQGVHDPKGDEFDNFRNHVVVSLREHVKRTHPLEIENPIDLARTIAIYLRQFNQDIGAFFDVLDTQSMSYPIQEKGFDQFMSRLLCELSPQKGAVLTAADGTVVKVAVAIEPESPTAEDAPGKDKEKTARPNQHQMKAWGRILSMLKAGQVIDEVGTMCYQFQMKIERRRSKKMNEYDLVCSDQEWRPDEKECLLRLFGALSIYYRYEALGEKAEKSYMPDRSEKMATLERIIVKLGGGIED